MLGTSRASWAGVDEYLSGLFDQASVRGDLMAAGRQVLDVADLLDTDAALRSTLSDAARGSAAKQDLVGRIFSARVGQVALDVLDRVCGASWGSDADLVDAVESAGEILLLMNAEAGDRIETVEEEVFRFGRAIDANPPLQMALTDPANSAQQKAAIVGSLLAGRTAAETPILLGHLVAHLRGRRVQDAVTALSELAAARHGRVVAEVRSAIALTADQGRRLAVAVAALQGRQVEVNVIVDPHVIGGIEVRVGDEVIDGTIAGRLEQARRRVAG